MSHERRAPGTVGVLGLAVVMLSVAAPLHLLADRLDEPGSTLSVPVWMVALAFLASESLRVPLHVRGNAHTVSLSEIPLLMGAVVVAPSVVVLSRLVAVAGAQIMHRTGPLRLAFNLPLCYLETVTVIVAYRALLGGRSPVSASGLGIASVALLGGVLLGAAMVALALVATRPGVTLAHAARSMLSGLGISAISVAVAVGSLAIVWSEPAALIAVALVVGGIYAGLRVHFALTRRYRDLESVYGFTNSIDRTDTTGELIEATLRQCTELFDADLAEVVVSRGVGSTVTWLESPEGSPQKRPAPPAVLEVLDATATGPGGSVSLAEAALPIRDHYEARGFSTGMVATLAGGGGTATMIVVGRRSRSKVGKDELRLFDTLARQARVAFERVWLVDRLRLEVGQKEHQVLHDSLTGLPNRLHFSIVIEEALRRAGEHDRTLAVLLIDLDRFKEINDTLGHQRGDVLLREMAMRLTEATGSEEHLARLGGDEFGVVLSGVTGIADAIGEARRYLEVLDRPITTEGLTVQISASIGIALAPDHGSDGTTLLRRADVAMYEAKERGSSIEVYDPQRDQYSTRRLALAGELRDAVDSGAISVHYQPKARLVDAQVIGIEALSRWIHPSHGVVPPDEFISLAEKTGIIRPLTEHVMRTAFHDAVRLRSEGHHLSVAVNIAASSLMDLEFPNLVALVIGETNIDPQAVILEVTESTMMTDSARARVVLDALDEIGVELSIDDFGTGYSSLSYLSVLPVDEVKIDRSFVTDMATDRRLAKIVTSTTALVHSLDLRVVAEGVESRGTWDLLRQADCDVGQGFYLAKPMDFTDLVAWLSTGSIAEGDRSPRLMSG